MAYACSSLWNIILLSHRAFSYSCIFPAHSTLKWTVQTKTEFYSSLHTWEGRIEAHPHPRQFTPIFPDKLRLPQSIRPVVCSFPHSHTPNRNIWNIPDCTHCPTRSAWLQVSHAGRAAQSPGSFSALDPGHVKGWTLAFWTVGTNRRLQCACTTTKVPTSSPSL